MNIRFLGTVLAMACLLGLLPRRGAAEEQHPRVLATPKLLEAIRAEVGKKGSHHQQVYEAIKTRVELSYTNMQKAYAGGGEEAAEPLKPEDYAWGYRARETAFLSLLAMTPDEHKKYAELSFKAAMETALVKPEDLAGRMGAMSIALAYDWGYPGWTDQQRAAVRQRALAHLKRMPVQDRVAQEYPFNKGGVHGGSELLLMLALGEEGNLKARYEHVKKHLVKHIETCYDAWGVSQEGPGYSEYPGSFLVPATLAARQLGDEDLAKALAGRSFWKLLMYAWTFMDAERQSVMWGVGSGSGPGEGWASALLGTVPADQLPHYLWFYDRAEGILSPKPPHQRFDPHRGNSPLAMLCYPIGVAAKDPTGAFPKVYYSETRGFAFLRNRWKDADDIMVTLSADAYKNAMGWDQPDALAVNLMAYNTRFFGAHAKRGKITDYSTLLVDGKYGSGKSLGKVGSCESTKDGVYVIVDGGPTYANLGCDSVQRHLLARFADNQSQALVSTLDRIKSSVAHTYTWQGNLGNEAGDDGVKASGGTEGGRPTFLLQGRNNGFVKGWVVHPAEAKVSIVETRVVRKKPAPQPKEAPAKQSPQVQLPSLDKTEDADGGIALEVLPPPKKPAAGAPQPEEVEILRDPLQITVNGDNTDIWVVIFVGQGTPPEATVAGTGLDSVLSVAGNKVRFDGGTNRLSLKAE